jgi:hypothetical protein
MEETSIILYPPYKFPRHLTDDYRTILFNLEDSVRHDMKLEPNNKETRIRLINILRERMPLECEIKDITAIVLSDKEKYDKIIACNSKSF